MPDVPVIGVLWYDQQALFCSDKAEPADGLSVCDRQVCLTLMVRTGQRSLLVPGRVWLGTGSRNTADRTVVACSVDGRSGYR